MGHTVECIHLPLVQSPLIQSSHTKLHTLIDISPLNMPNFFFIKKFAKISKKMPKFWGEIYSLVFCVILLTDKQQGRKHNLIGGDNDPNTYFIILHKVKMLMIFFYSHMWGKTLAAKCVNSNEVGSTTSRIQCCLLV